MNLKQIGLASVLLVPSMSSPAGVRCVNLNSSRPSSPYVDWTTAATNVAHADLITWCNGVYRVLGPYQTGRRVVPGETTRVP